MKIKTQDLIGPALDWAVDVANGGGSDPEVDLLRILDGDYSPSTDWSDGGPLIEREDIALCRDEGWWMADCCPDQGGEQVEQYGPTPLVAAMRCYVASKLGDEVEVPDEVDE